MMLLSISLLVSMWIIQSVDSRSLAHIITRDGETHRFTKRAKLIPNQTYVQIQISDGPTGKCGKKAEDKFLSVFGLTQAQLIKQNPFQGPIDPIDLKTCNQMTRLAVDAEQGFNNAIGNQSTKFGIGKQLDNGKTCNKVLKLTGTVLGLQMEIKLGKADATRLRKLANEINKLQKNIDADARAPNQKQRSFLTS
ncbi:hypothetical protein PGT21_027365 [Puccinia graminis f. sp. tritici]|uniref:Secreted protein n=1 Tax=Puccinia graminis f. sp. tritici TaxID=56615 RepID=A0A5B0MPV0_PUCGR|nr:hypothetical protein PGT21_027365 [Puccinia graminis f. sp. tritici]